MFFLDPNIGYVSGAQGTILKTMNGGNNWLQQNTETTYDLGCLFFVNSNIGYASIVQLNQKQILKTTNGGLNWISYSTSRQLNQIYFTSANTGYATLNDIIGSGILKTTNGGLNWSYQNINIRYSMKSVYFLDSLTGYLGGEAGFIYKTTDAGYSWNELSSHRFETNFWSIQFLDINLGFISCDSGLIVKTTNGGNNWTGYPTGTLSRFEELFFINSNTGYAVGSGATIVKTTNGGNNWTQLNPGISTLEWLESVYFTDVNTGYIVGGQLFDHHLILKTTNAGSNWYQIHSSQSYDLLSIRFTDANTGYTAGEQQKILKTTNAGTNWFEQYSGSFYILDEIDFLNADTGCIVGYSEFSRGVILRTTNGGSNWNTILTTGPNLYSVHFPDNNTGYAAGNVTYKTTNGGLNWFMLPVAGTTIYFTSGSTGYTAGWGIILKTTTGGGNPIGIEPISQKIPEKFRLSQNYPNPFNPSTTIKFDVPSVETIHELSLRIYDILGRQVTVLVNEELKPGTYEVQWDGSNYASGIYFYTLKTSEFIETKKMLLVK